MSLFPIRFPNPNNRSTAAGCPKAHGPVTPCSGSAGPELRRGRPYLADNPQLSFSRLDFPGAQRAAGSDGLGLALKERFGSYGDAMTGAFRLAVRIAGLPF